MAITKLLAAHRKQRGYSLRQVGRITGYSNTYVAMIERRECEPSLRCAMELCKCYGITIGKLANLL